MQANVSKMPHFAMSTDRFLSRWTPLFLLCANAANSSKGHIPLCDIMQGPTPFVGPLPSPSMVTVNPNQALLNRLRYLSPEYFRAGEIQNHVSVWEHLLSEHGSSQLDLTEIIREGVRIYRLFKPFKGNFKDSSHMNRCSLLPWDLTTPRFVSNSGSLSLILSSIG